MTGTSVTICNSLRRLELENAFLIALGWLTVNSGVPRFEAAEIDIEVDVDAEVLGRRKSL